MTYYLTTASTVDLSKDYLDDMDVKVINNRVYINEEEFPDDLGKTISFEKFYTSIIKESDVSTSQLNMNDFIDFFEPLLKKGKDIVHVDLSSSLSGTYNSCTLAAKELEEKYPDRKIYTIDSLNASTGIGVLVDKLAQLRDQGLDARELYEWGEENKDYFHTWGYCTDLSHYLKGGRISKTSALIGGLLNVCPLLKLTLDGKLTISGKVRTRRKAKEFLMARFEEDCKKGIFYDGKIFISHSHMLDDAEDLKKRFKEKYPNVEDIVISYIGTNIGAHTGAGTVAIMYIGKNKKPIE